MKKLYSKILTVFALGFMGVAGLASIGNVSVDQSTVVKAAEPTVVCDKMTSEWNGRLSDNGKFYVYLIHFTSSLSSDGKGDSTNLVPTIGDNFQLNGKTFTSYADSILSINYANGGKYLTINIPIPLLVEQEGKGGAFVHIDSGTPFKDSILPEITLTIDLETKLGALNAQAVTFTGFDGNKLGWGWYALNFSGLNYGFNKTATLAYGTGSYKDEAGLNYTSKIYVNGNPAKKFVDHSSGSKSLTYCLNKDETAYTFQVGDLIEGEANIQSITIKKGAFLPAPNADGSSIVKNTVYVVTEDTTVPTAPYSEEANYGLMTLSNIATNLTFPLTVTSATTTYFLNNMSPIAGNNFGIKFKLRITSGVQTEFLFHLGGDYNQEHYKVQMNTNAGKNGSAIQMKLGTTTDASGTVVSDSWKAITIPHDYDNVFEIYSITKASGTRWTVVINGVSVLDMTVTTVNPGRVYAAKWYQNGTAAVTVDDVDVMDEAVSMFKNKGLKMDTISTEDHSDTGACKGSSGYYKVAKDYFTNCLTAAQKTEFAKDEAAVARLTAWAAANGEVFNGTTFSSAKIGFINENNDAAVIAIAIITTIAVSILACYCFYRRKKHN